MNAQAPTPDSPTGGLCPQCGAPAIRRWRPFCSKRCADVDLARWLKGSYALPAEDQSAPEDDHR